MDPSHLGMLDHQHRKNADNQQAHHREKKAFAHNNRGCLRSAGQRAKAGCVSGQHTNEATS